MYQNLKAFVCPGCAEYIEPKTETLHQHLRRCISKLDSDENSDNGVEIEIHANQEMEELQEEEPIIQEHKIMKEIIKKINPPNHKITEDQWKKIRTVFSADLQETEEIMTLMPSPANIRNILKDTSRKGRFSKLKIRILSKFNASTQNLITEDFLQEFLNPWISEERAYANTIVVMAAAFSAAARKPEFLNNQEEHYINYSNPVAYRRKVMENCVSNRDLLADESNLVRWVEIRKNCRRNHQKRKKEAEEDKEQEIKRLREEVQNLEEENEELRRKKKKQDIAVTRRSEYLYSQERVSILEKKQKNYESFKKVARAFCVTMMNDIIHMKLINKDPEDYNMEIPDEEEQKYPPEVLKEFKALLLDPVEKDEELETEESTDESTDDTLTED